MRILYVTPLWSGFSDLILKGQMDASGMPAFIQPLKKLIELGHKVDFIIASNEKQLTLNIQVDWLKNSSFYAEYWSTRGLKRISSVIRLYRRIKHVVSNNQYDFIYGHGSHGVIGNIVADQMGIPSAQRLYGTFLAQEVLTKHRYYIALKHPLDYLSYQYKKEFLLVTNDGTHGDVVYRHLNKRNRFKFFFWLNGVDSKRHNGDQCHDSNTSFAEKFIFYPARIDAWKRQDLALTLLSYLHDMGQKDVKLYFAGHIYDLKYWDKIKSEVARLKLEDSVIYLGAVNKNELYHAYGNAICVLSFYDISNLGNVFIEGLDAGAIIVSLKDSSLDDIINSGKNGFLISNMKEAAVCINDLICNPTQRLNIASAAKETAKEYFMKWDDRAMKEIEQIKLSLIPPVSIRRGHKQKQFDIEHQ